MDVRDRNDFCWPYTYVRWWPGGPTTRSNASMLLKIRSQWWVVSECMRYSTAHGVGMVYRVFLLLLSEIFYFRLTSSTIDSRNYSRDQPDNTHSFPSYASCSILHFPHPPFSSIPLLLSLLLLPPKCTFLLRPPPFSPTTMPLPLCFHCYARTLVPMMLMNSRHPLPGHLT